MSSDLCMVLLEHVGDEYVVRVRIQLWHHLQCVPYVKEEQPARILIQLFQHISRYEGVGPED